MTKRVGVLGAGNVAGALFELLSRRSVDVDVIGVLVRDTARRRQQAVPHERLTTSHAEVVERADIVVELMGGTALAGDLIVKALAAGKRVVTANKAVLAERWHELEAYAARGMLYFEASVMAGTPVVGALSGALRGSSPFELHAILNGTCNYIIGRLESGASLRLALEEAQSKGFAEPDPTLDVSGIDAAHKLTVLGRLAFDPHMDYGQVRANTRGIEELTPEIAALAAEQGRRVRLVASITALEGRWHGTVGPVKVPQEHPLAQAADSRNGMWFRGDPVGEVFVAGAGAGPGPTASAVLADLMAACSNLPGPAGIPKEAAVPRDTLPPLFEPVDA